MIIAIYIYLSISYERLLVTYDNFGYLCHLLYRDAF